MEKNEQNSNQIHILRCNQCRRASFNPSGGRLNITMQSYQYKDSHVKDKTVSPTVLYLT